MPEYVRIRQNTTEYARIEQNVHEYTKILHNTPEYTRTRQNMPEHVRIHQNTPGLGSPWGVILGVLLGRASGTPKSAKAPGPLKVVHFTVRKSHLEPFSAPEPLWAHLGVPEGSFWEFF